MVLRYVTRIFDFTTFLKMNALKWGFLITNLQGMLMVKVKKKKILTAFWIILCGKQQHCKIDETVTCCQN